MKRIVLLASLFVSLCTFLNATGYTIGTGTDTDYSTPINTYYNYSWSRSIYTKAEINAAGLNTAGNIVSLGIQVSQTPPNFLMENQYIYMRHTTATVETAPYSGTTGFTLVYTGPIMFLTPGWKIIDLATPFAWNNTDNIEILWESYDGNYLTEYPVFLHHNTTTNMSVHNYQDSAFPLTDGILTSSRPNLMLYSAGTSGPEPCIAVSPQDGTILVPVQTTLSWTSGGGAPTGYRLYLGTNDPPPLIGDLGQVLTWTPTANLAFSTVYYWKVIPYNANGDAANCPVWSFTTRNEWDVTVGTEAYQAPLPVMTIANKSYSQFIYRHEDLLALHHKISAVAFHWTSEADNNYSNQVTVYMANTDRDCFLDNTQWVTLDSLTLVFTGYLNLSAGDRWISIPISPRFNYDITKNLVIAVDENTNGSDDANPGYFYCSQTYNSEPAGIVAMNYTDIDIPPSDPGFGADNVATLLGYPNIWLSFVDDIPPVISYLPVLNTPRSNAYIHFEATITDNIGVLDPKIWIAHLPSTFYESFPLTQLSESLYGMNYIGINLNDQISYYYTATDAEANLATSATNSFYVQDPTWLRYTGNVGTYLSWPSYVWGPLNLYANPFYGSDHQIKINAVEGRSRYAVTANIRIYSCTTNPATWANMQLVYGPAAVSLPAASTATFDLSALNINIDTPYFLVGFTEMPTGNYWARNAGLLYNNSYIIRNGGFYNSSGYGTWLVSAYVQTGADIVLAPPAGLSITDTPEGPLLSWTAVPGAPYYTIISSDDPNSWEFPNGNWEGNVSTTSFVYERSAEFARKYFRVIATTSPPSKARGDSINEVAPPPDDSPVEIME